jgi:cysteine sulfinate desulfinase/cysteine desulfurase-like protein
MKKKPMTNYLNYNSTGLIGGNRLFNSSDTAYEEVHNIRLEEAHVKKYIKDLVNASDDTHVIFTSGATESMATVLNWVKNYNKYGTVYGSKFDHNSIVLNCKNQDLKYKELNLKHILKNKTQLPLDASCIFLTHVSPHSGEIIPMNELDEKFDVSYLNDYNEESEINEDIIRQYKPLLILDASQSIGKTKIDMQAWNLNAVFFSLHKLGGKMNCGVLLIHDDINRPFKPLIAGKQQNAMRGGTYDVYSYLDFKTLYNNYVNSFDHEQCKKTWKKAHSAFKKAGLDVYEPEFKHLHNTILIKTKVCSYDMIKELAQYGIYVSGKTACDSLDKSDKESNLRISFINGDIDNKTINKIVEVVNKWENNSDELNELIDSDSDELN